jgi:hypothetical protein
MPTSFPLSHPVSRAWRRARKKVKRSQALERLLPSEIILSFRHLTLFPHLEGDKLQPKNETTDIIRRMDRSRDRAS